jgi:hypothetical protein
LLRTGLLQLTCKQECAILTAPGRPQFLLSYFI